MRHSLKNTEIDQCALSNALSELDLPGLPPPITGKVRQSYDIDAERRLLVATDRLSAFDRILTTIPFKGQVLTQLSQFWFDKTQHLCPNHMIAVPDPNVMVCKRLRMLPVEVVMLNERVPSPTTAKESAALVLPFTVPTSPVTEPAPAAVTTTVPPVPAVKVPKFSAAEAVCVIFKGATTVALAAPVAVAVLPVAA